MKVCGRLPLPFLRRKSRMLLVLVVGSALTAIACSETLPTTPKPSVYHATASFVNPAGPLILGSFAISFDGLPSETGALAEDQKRQILDETLRQAETALNEDHLEGALDKCRLAIELDPTSAQAYYLMGVAQGRRGASAEAKRALLQAVKLDPSQIATHLYLGKIHLQANDLRAAAGEYQAAIRL